MCRIQNGQMTLPSNALFTSLDFIANKKLSPKVVAQGANVKLPETSKLVIYECRNVINDEIKQIANVYVCEQSSHGWYSAIPALKQYYSQLQCITKDAGTSLKTNLVYLDRGSSVVWCAQFIAYACELANEFNITIQPNTTAAGEEKWSHDQVGGTVAQFIQHAVKIGSIKFGPNNSPAAKIAAHCSQHF